ncbi:hypothetical protein LZ554_002808 [Drepanopeziza brunnea f. sp. 'monogermtubi']|nr:hypothetical protein LZ554_002808 [Drepanopeziza brunnea f. sp. 'monogermtubi']
MDPSMSGIGDDEQEYQWYVPFSEADPEIDPATQALLAMNDGLPNHQEFVSFPQQPGQTSNPAFLQLLPEGPYSHHAAGPPDDMMMAAGWAPMQEQRTRDDGLSGMIGPWVEEPGPEMQGFQGWELPPVGPSDMMMAAAWASMQQQQRTQDDGLSGMIGPWVEEPGVEIQGFQGMQQIQDNELWMEPGREIQGFHSWEPSQAGPPDMMTAAWAPTQQQTQDDSFLGMNWPWMEPGPEIQGLHGWEPSPAGPPDMMTAAWAPTQQQTQDDSFLGMNWPWMEPGPEIQGFHGWEPSHQQEYPPLQMTNRPQVAPRQRNMWPKDTMRVVNASPYPEEMALDDYQEPVKGIGLGMGLGLGMDLPYPQGSQPQEPPQPQQEPGEPKQWLLQQSVFREPQMGPGSRGHVGMPQQRPPQSYNQPNHPSISIQPAARPPQVHTSGAPKCPHCDRQFPFHSRMRQHVRTYHDPSRPFFCSVERCNMRYNRSNDLVRHYADFHPDLPPAEADRHIQLACQQV